MGGVGEARVPSGGVVHNAAAVHSARVVVWVRWHLRCGSWVTSHPEVSEHLVGSAAFKAVGTGDPRPAGSIPVHLRQPAHGRPWTTESGLR